MRTAQEMDVLRMKYRDEVVAIRQRLNAENVPFRELGRMVDEELDHKHAEDVPQTTQGTDTDEGGKWHDDYSARHRIEERARIMRETISDHCPDDCFPAFSWQAVRAGARRQILANEAMPPLETLMEKIPFTYEKHARGHVNVWPERSRP